jgi:hypothetical protein
MQTGDFRDLLDPTVAQPRCLTARDPPPLLLIQPAEQRVQLSMLLPLRMVAQPTCQATTLINHYRWC